MSQDAVFITGMCIVVAVLAALLVLDTVWTHKRRNLPEGRKTLLQ